MNYTNPLCIRYYLPFPYMKKFLSVFFLLCLPLSVLALGTNEKITATVVRVIDGDTIQVDMSGTIDTVRILDIDTPEKYITRTGYTECYGEEASKYATDLLSGKTIELEWDAKQKWRDIYDRLLAYVWVDGYLYGEKAIQDGYSFRYTKKATKYRKVFLDAEKLAKTSHIGVWDICNGKREPLVNTGTTLTPTQSGTTMTKATKSRVIRIKKAVAPKTQDTTGTGSTWIYSCSNVPRYCKDVKTRDEAQYYLNTCHVTLFDRDNDWIACEDVR